MAKRPTIAIVGCGRAGGAIGLALARKGYTIAAAWSKSRAGRQRAQRLLDVPVLPAAADAAAAGNLVFVAVPDDAIEEMSAEIAPGTRSGQIVAHTSGGTSVDALATVRASGARTASVHPLQSFPDAERGAEALEGASVAVTADPRDKAALFRVARAWGGRPFTLADQDKTLYHAAAVFASNAVVTSVWSALRILERIGVQNAPRLIAPLVEAAAANAVEIGPDKAITGPVVRGDAETLKKHVEALSQADPTGGRITDAYRTLARLTAALARADLAAVERATA